MWLRCFRTARGGYLRGPLREPEVRLFLLVPGFSVGGRLACMPMPEPGPGRLRSQQCHSVLLALSSCFDPRPHGSSGCYLARFSPAPRWTAATEDVGGQSRARQGQQVMLVELFRGLPAI